MSLISNPYGFQPISDQSGELRPVRIPNGIANTLASNIFKFQPVKLASGVITPVTAITDQIFAIFAGVEFTPLGGRPTESPFWPANTNFDPSYDMFVYVWPAWLPSLRLQVQADGAVAQALLGSQFNISTATIANGSTTIGLSQASVLHGGVAQGTQGQFALTEFAQGNTQTLGSLPGDAFTDLICTIAYPQVGSGYQTSIG